MELNKIYNDDCLNITRSIDSNSVDLTVFSPPYDNIRDYTGYTLNLPALAKSLYRVTKDGGVCAIVIGDGTKNFAKSLSSFRLALNWCDEAGWRLFETCIYQRHGSPGAWWNQRFRVDHEYILIFFKGDRPKAFDKGHMMVPSKHAGATWHGTKRMTDGSTQKIEPKKTNLKKCRGTIWFYNTSNSEGNRLKLKHPATYPDKLAEDLILCFSKPGDLVLDPMCGSGTTCAMAKINDRRYIGVDISKEYCEIAEQRTSEAELKPDIREWT